MASPILWMLEGPREKSMNGSRSRISSFSIWAMQPVTPRSIFRFPFMRRSLPMRL